ncbi:MAG: large-conductance mechanosensitive channel protein MscL [Sarcina sp.]
MKKFISEFKEFAMKGNVVDLAIGVVVGGAFSQIVNALVKDIIMPIFSVITGGINYSSWNIVLKPAEGKHAAIILSGGLFIQAIINFLIIAVSIFVCIKIVGKFYQREKKEKPIPADVQLLTEIRDFLKNEDKINEEKK